MGGGFAGLAAARALRRAAIEVTLVDRHNHHVFQPLLYQVATAGLSPADIAAPIRWVLRRQRNVRVLLGEAAASTSRRGASSWRDGAPLPTTTPWSLATGVTHPTSGTTTGRPRARAEDARRRAWPSAGAC